ncbi:MAG: biotin/lipoyl-binding protein [Nitrospira sp.]|nr:biotin/lipoyl-binding protein [Nitrospira sp.]
MSHLSRHPFIALGIAVVFVLAALLLVRLSTGAKTDTPKPRLVTVGIVSPIRQDLDVRLSYTADISPNQVVNIFSRVDGYIAKLHIDKGDFARADQLLLEIDHTDYRHAVNQAKPTCLPPRQESRSRMRWFAMSSSHSSACNR